ncbi:hypothetical protein PHJA_000418900 [Phtheirospermum japonicum]|uniref:Uncharacterized protein n=1 Tax=Phtheirospermum japonicum TaxID=374723 RepID=A0A830BCE3_9LAMI|nr:hypothetical protein PHJA_000418900 [Phtheirospermum japonicum]
MQAVRGTGQAWAAGLGLLWAGVGPPLLERHISGGQIRRRKKIKEEDGGETRAAGKEPNETGAVIRFADGEIDDGEKRSVDIGAMVDKFCERETGGTAVDEEKGLFIGGEAIGVVCTTPAEENVGHRFWEVCCMASKPDGGEASTDGGRIKPAAPEEDKSENTVGLGDYARQTVAQPPKEGSGVYHQRWEREGLGTTSAEDAAAAVIACESAAAGKRLKAIVGETPWVAEMEKSLSAGDVLTSITLVRSTIGEQAKKCTFFVWIDHPPDALNSRETEELRDRLNACIVESQGLKNRVGEAVRNTRISLLVTLTVICLWLLGY